MRLIDADELPKQEIKDENEYINPSYARGWNDATRAIYLYAPAIEEEAVVIEYFTCNNISKIEDHRIGKEWALVRRGHWIVDEDGNITCSVCGNGSSNDNFCEHCGAKMEEEK